MFDSHCHLDFEDLRERLPAHLEAAARAGVEGWLIPGCEVEKTGELQALRATLAARYAVWIAAGQHPYFASRILDLRELERGLQHAIEHFAPVALGECGVDAKRGGEPAHQLRVLGVHLQVARDSGLPIVLHQVGMRDDFLQLIDRVGLPERGGVVHGFSGDEAWAKALLRRGLHLGVGAALTRPARRRLREAVRVAPLSALLLETDAPDQRVHAPDSSATAPGSAMMGVPLDLLQVGIELARLRGMDPGALSCALRQNAEQLFGIVLGDVAHGRTRRLPNPE